MIKHLLEISQKKLKLLTILAFAGFIVFLVLMTVIGDLPPSGYNIIDFEFARTAQRADTIMTAWGETIVKNQIVVTYLDYGLLVSYGFMAFGLVLLAAREMKDTGKLRKMGLVICFFPLIAALCDALENVNLLFMLYGFPAGAVSINALLASIFALIKFGLLGIVLIFFVVQLVFLFIKKIKGV